MQVEVEAMLQVTTRASEVDWRRRAQEEVEAPTDNNVADGDTVLEEANEDSLAQIAQVSGELATPGGPNHRKYADEGTAAHAGSPHVLRSLVNSYRAGRPRVEEAQEARLHL